MCFVFKLDWSHHLQWSIRQITGAVIGCILSEKKSIILVCVCSLYTNNGGKLRCISQDMCVEL